MKKFIQSYARNISTEAALATLVKDMSGSYNYLGAETATLYLEALEHLMVIEQLPAWNTYIRSKDTLRKKPKRHFVDSSLAVGALDFSVDKLLNDLEYFGLLFESLVIRDLRIYGEVHGAKLFHYRDSTNLEVDAVLEYPDGKWALFEIKLGFGSQDDAADNLIKLSNKIDQSHLGPPAALTVITSNGFAYRRDDGVNVVPLGTLSV